MPLRRWVGRAQGHLLLAWIILFTGASFQGFRENRQRIADIQEARLSSCKQTYEGIREVFMPLFPPNPNPAQQKTLRTFNKTIDDLKAGCGRQTRTG